MWPPKMQDLKANSLWWSSGWRQAPASGTAELWASRGIALMPWCAPARTSSTRRTPTPATPAPLQHTPAEDAAASPCQHATLLARGAEAQHGSGSNARCAWLYPPRRISRAWRSPSRGCWRQRGAALKLRPLVSGVLCEAREAPEAVSWDVAIERDARGPPAQLRVGSLGHIINSWMWSANKKKLPR